MKSLNRNKVAIQIEKRLSRTESSKRTKWCIYRVPNKIRRHNKEAYTPQVVSIGPFHYGNERLQNVQTHKWEYFKKFIQRSGTNLDDLVSFIEELEPSVRHCYAENIVFDEKKFVKIILLDACFIIELFMSYYHGPWSEDDPLSPQTGVFNDVLLDLLLLENQLPFFVLEKIFNWVPSFASNNLPPFLRYTFQCFSYYNKQELNPDGVAIRHFTDLLRYFYLPQPPRRPKRIGKNEVLCFSATKLHDAGLEFEVINHARQCLLELQLSGDVLKIPKILVEDRTEVLFRNMVAFEQCHYLYESYIYDYVRILDFLINTEKDVDVLVHKEIIINRIDDSKAMAKMINGLGRNVLCASGNSCYNQLCRKLNEFCTNPCRERIATLKRDYCRTAWQTVASIAGIILLFLTLLQTIFSGIQVTQQSKNA